MEEALTTTAAQVSRQPQRPLRVSEIASQVRKAQLEVELRFEAAALQRRIGHEALIPTTPPRSSHGGTTAREVREYAHAVEKILDQSKTPP